MDQVSVPSFYDANASSWIWGSIITANNDVVQTGIINWPSHLCSLTGNGYTTGVGMNVAMRRINNTLWDRIPETDVRKTWWVDADTLSVALDKAYGDPTIGIQLGFAPYTNVKFGTVDNILLNTENSQDWPLMRAEEMILIKAEALARSEGVGAGMAELESFVKTYRDPSYICTAASLDSFIDEVWYQRRIELWGEGLIWFDIMRLNKPVDRRGAGFPNATSVFNIQPGDPILLWRLPENEIMSNPMLSSEDNNQAVDVPQPVADVTE